MPPGVQVNITDLPAYAPSATNAIVGVIGPATKGPVNTLGQFTDVGNFVATHGRPVNYQHGPRAAIRYLRRGNQLRFVRIAGTLLSKAFVEQWKTISGELIPIVKFEGASEGSWANGDVDVIITHNGDPATSYNIWVRYRGRIVEKFDNLTNSTAETEVNRESSYITMTLHPDAGTTFPDETRDDTTEALVPLVLADGDDGAFASTKSPDSSAGGMSQANSFSYSIPNNTTKIYSNDEPRTITPGSLVVTDGTETFSDDGEGVLTGDATGTGRVNYYTGEWDVEFNAAPAGAVSVSYTYGTYEVLGSASSGTASYSGTVGREGVNPSYMSIKETRYDQLDKGDGLTAAYTPTIAADIVPGSITITAIDTAGNTMTVTDDGDGALTGDLAAPGTINYVTGVSSFTFNANVANGEEIMCEFDIFIVDDGAGVLSGDSVAGTINYKSGAWTLVHTLTPAGDYVPALKNAAPFESVFRHCTVLDFGDAAETEFSGTLKEHPIKPGTAEVYYTSGSPLTDDGNGNISGAGGSGTINYYTGEVEVEFTSPPAASYPVRVLYDPIRLQFTSIYAGPIGNERTTLEDGLYIHVDKATNTPVANYSQLWYRVRLFFNDGSGAAVIETFDNLKTVSELIETINDDDNGSEYVRVSDTGVPGDLDASYDSWNGQKMGMAGAFTNSDVIGAKVGPVYTGLQLFSNYEAVPLHFLTAPGIYHRQVQNAGIDLANLSNRLIIWIYSIPDFDDIYNADDYVNGEYNAASPGGIAVPKPKIPYPPLSAVDGDVAAAFFSWVQYNDQYSGEDVWEPPEGEILDLIAQVEKTRGPYYPLAGERRGQVIVDAVRYSPDKGERTATYGLVGTTIHVINPLVDMIGRGIYLYGQRTMARSAIPGDRIHVVWTSNVIAKEILANSGLFPFELNDEVLWREMEAIVLSILNPIIADRGIDGYRIVCDATVNTAAVISQKKAICKVFITYKEVAEEIEYDLVRTPATVSFSEVAPLG